MNADRLDIEFALMNYPSYIGASPDGRCEHGPANLHDV